MKKTLLFLPLLILAGCSASGNLPQAFQDPGTSLYGFKGSSGVVVIPPKYVEVKPFNDAGIAQAYDPTQGWVEIDRMGSVFGE